MLAQALAELPELENQTSPSDAEPASYTLARALIDIAESARSLAEAHIPAMTGAAPLELRELLHEAREELRHIVYHVRDTPYLRTIA
jgi:hypothetical protein